MLTISEDVRSSLELIGWSLLHFVWQGSVLAILLLFALGPVRKSAARVREGLALLTLGLMGLCPVVTACWMASESPTAHTTLVNNTRPAADPVVAIPAIESQSYDLLDEPAVEVPAAPPLPDLEPVTFDPPLPVMIPPAPRWQLDLSDWISWLAVAWLSGVLGLSFRLVMGWRIVQRLRRLATPISTGPWREAFDAVLTQMKLSAPVQLAESILVEVPTVIGWWSPVILVPASLLSGMSSHEIAAILAHELAHIRRHDYLINLCQTVVETLLFYHPAVWWVSSRIRQEREQACDDEAVATCGDVVAYARALLALEEHRLSRSLGRTSPLVVAASGGSLRDRISRLIDPTATVPQTPGLACFVIVAAAALLIGAISVATQASGHVSSAKPSSESAQEKEVGDTPGSDIQDQTADPGDQQQEAQWHPLLQEDLAKGVPLERDHVIAIVDGHPIYALDEFDEHLYRQIFNQAKKEGKDPKAAVLRLIRYKTWGTNPHENPTLRYLMLKRAKERMTAQELNVLEERVSRMPGFSDRPINLDRMLFDEEMIRALNRHYEREIIDAYLKQNADRAPKPTAADIKALYDERHLRYHTPEGTKWQRIDVNFDKYATRDEALAAANTLRKEIENGLSFNTAACQRSDSSLAAVSGLSHWMTPPEVNELTDLKLRDTLQTLPEGDISPLIALEKSYTIIRIIGRRPESIVPLETASARIAEEISTEHARQANVRLIEELVQNAEIHSIIDPDWDMYWAKRSKRPKATSQIAPPKPKPSFRPLLRKDIELGVPLESNHVVAIVDGDPIYALDMISKGDYQLCIKDEKKRGTDRRVQMFRSLRHPLRQYNHDYILLSGQIPQFLSGLKKYLGSEPEPGYYISIPICHALAKKYKSLAPAAEVEAVREAALKQFDSDLLLWGKQLLKAGIIKEGEDVGKKRYGDLLESSRKQFIEREMAIAFFELTARTQPKPTDEDIKARYQEQYTRYHTSQGTRWQRIDINFDKHPTRELALSAAETIHQEIQSGLNFDLAASQRSDSSLAAISGLSHWMSPTELDELSNDQLREKLKTLPEGGVSSIIELENCYSIIRIIGRRHESTVPLESLSSRLAQEIWEEQNVEAQCTLINELFNKADIHTILDPDWDAYWAKRPKATSLIELPKPKPSIRPLLRKEIEQGLPLADDHVFAMVDGDPFYVVDFIIKDEYQQIVGAKTWSGKDRENAVLSILRSHLQRGGTSFYYFDLMMRLPVDNRIAYYKFINADNILVNHYLAKMYKAKLSPAELAEFHKKAEQDFREHLINRGMQLRMLERGNVDPDNLGTMLYGDLLASYRQQFINFKFAAAYFEFIARSQPEPTLTDIQSRYQDQFSLYHTPEGTKYQRIDLNYNKYPTREAALAAARSLRLEILNGLSFHVAATERSDSHLTAIRGLSHWMPLAEVNELKDKPLREALKTLPEGEISSVLELQNCCSIIRVIGRRNEMIVPLEKVASQLSQDIRTERITETRRNLFADVSTKADIHTILDANWDEYWASRLGNASNVP